MIRVLLLGFILLLPACGGVKDAFTLKKKSSADEFLVEKKSPLVIPPDFGKLPKPANQSDNFEENKNENEIEKLLTNKKDNVLSNENNSQSLSLENSILKKIK